MHRFQARPQGLLSIRRRTVPALLLAAVAVMTCAAGCGSSKGTASGGLTDRDVVVAAVPATGAAALYIAEQRGLFTAAGLRVKIESSVSAADVVTDVINGSVNVSLGQWTSAIAVQATGVRLRALAAGNAGGPGLEELVTGAHSGITKLSQLRGKTIAVNALSGLSQMLAQSALARAGVTPSQVHFTVVPFPAMASALSARRVGAAFMIQPYLAASSGQVTELADIDAGTTEAFPITGYITSAAWQAKNPATVAAFTRALAKGQQIAATDRAAVQQAMVKYTGVSAQIAATMALGVFPLSVTSSQLDRVADLMKSDGLLPGSATVTSVVAGMLQ